jgi:hypothetical protein
MFCRNNWLIRPERCNPGRSSTDTTPPDIFPEQSIAHTRPRNEAKYGSCIEGYDSWFAGPAVAESL